MRDGVPRQARRALVLEGAHTTRTMLTGLLKSAGFAHIQGFAETGPATIAASRERFELIIVGLALGRTTGIELCRTVRVTPAHVNRNAAMLVVSAWGAAGAIQTARDAGVTAFLIKPFTTAAFCARVARALSDARPFVESPSYYGPDRRTADSASYRGRDRRNGQAAHYV